MGRMGSGNVASWKLLNSAGLEVGLEVGKALTYILLPWYFNVLCAIFTSLPHYTPTDGARTYTLVRSLNVFCQGCAGWWMLQAESELECFFHRYFHTHLHTHTHSHLDSHPLTHPGWDQKHWPTCCFVVTSFIISHFAIPELLDCTSMCWISLRLRSARWSWVTWM